MSGSDHNQTTGFETKVLNEVRTKLGLALAERFGQDELRPRVESLFDDVLTDENVTLSGAERQKLLETVVADLLGYGPLEPLLADETVTEILVDGAYRIYVERHGQLEDIPFCFRDDEHLMEKIQLIFEPLGRRVDESSPYADARLPDGSRVNAIIPPLSLNGPTLTIRKFAKSPLTTEQLVQFGTWNEDIVRFLQACVQARLNIAIAGGTGSGKTTVLNCIAEMIPDEERIVTIENAAELFLLYEKKKYVVPLESRPANAEGKGEVTIRDLVINASRMRPDRIIVGEVRGHEAIDVLQILNTGHDGSLFTIHADSPRDVFARLESLVLSTNPSLPLLHIGQEVASAIDLIVYQGRVMDGSRKILNVTEVNGVEGESIVLQDLFMFRQTGFEGGRVLGYHSATGIVPHFLSRLQELGIDLPMELFVPK